MNPRKLFLNFGGGSGLKILAVNSTKFEHTAKYQGDPHSNVQRRDPRSKVQRTLGASSKYGTPQSLKTSQFDNKNQNSRILPLNFDCSLARSYIAFGTGSSDPSDTSEFTISKMHISENAEWNKQRSPVMNFIGPAGT